MEELMKETKAGQTVPTSETEPKKKFGLPKSKKAKKWMKICLLYTSPSPRDCS